MLSALQVVVLTLDSLPSTFEAAVPTQALRDYFGPFGIDLQFSLGLSLIDDPTDSTDSIREFVSEHAPPLHQRGPAILVIADIGYLGPLVNGMLMDADRRGACAVFTQATGFAFGNADSRFEIFAHEIGHMLNLTHGDADETYPTAMNSWGERVHVVSRSDIWREAISDGSGPFAQQLRQYFGSGHRQPLGLPLSKSCCRKLSGFPDPAIAPWLSEFEGQGAEDLPDAVKGPLRCLLEIHGEAWTVAQPLDFTVTFELGGDQSMIVPALLERTSGELLIQVMQPDGKTRFLRPRQSSCTSAIRRLAPKQKIWRHDSLFSDREDLVFPLPGRYRIRAVVPQTGSRSKWIGIEVAPASGVLADPAMQAFLRRGMPPGADAHWRDLMNMASDKRVAAQLRTDVSSRAAGRGHGLFEPVRRVNSYASPAVAQQDALRRIAHARRNAKADPEGLHLVLDHAEKLFDAADREHPTLGYLAYVRRRLLQPYQRRR